MDAEIEKNVLYYNFLAFVQDVSKKLNSIQNQARITVYQNYDLRVFKKGLNKQIKDIDKLLDK